MLRKTKLVIGSVILGILGFSPMLLSIIGKGNKKGDLEINPNYYNSPKETLFKDEVNNLNEPIKKMGSFEVQHGERTSLILTAIIKIRLVLFIKEV